jgi:WD40 repeat protein
MPGAGGLVDRSHTFTINNTHIHASLPGNSPDKERKDAEPGSSGDRRRAEGALARSVLRKIWEEGSSFPLVSSRRNTAPIVSLGFLHDDTRLASCSASGAVRLWESAGLRQSGGTIDAAGQAMALSPVERILAVGSTRGSGEWSVAFWDVEVWQPIRAVPVPGSVQALAYAPDGRTVAVRSAGDARVHLVSPLTGKRLRALGPEQDGGPPSSGGRPLVVFSPDGRLVATTNRSGTGVVFLDFVTGKTVGPPLVGTAQHSNAVASFLFGERPLKFEALAFSPDGRIAATCGGDRTVRLWDLERREQIAAPLTGHRRGVNAVAFSPSGRLLASGGNDKRVLLWDVAQHKQAGPALTGHTKPVVSVAFSSDDRVLATGSVDRTVRLWIAPPASRR